MRQCSPSSIYVLFNKHHLWFQTWLPQCINGTILGRHLKTSFRIFLSWAKHQPSPNHWHCKSVAVSWIAPQCLWPGGWSNGCMMVLPVLALSSMQSTSQAFAIGQILWQSTQLCQGHTGNGSWIMTGRRFPIALCLQGGIAPWLNHENYLVAWFSWKKSMCY